MLDTVLQILSIISMIIGLFFLVVAIVGLLRLPDVYNRLHATSKCDTLGAGLVLLSLALQSEMAVAIRLALLIIFVLITNPTAAHVIARVAYTTGIKPQIGRSDSND